MTLEEKAVDRMSEIVSNNAFIQMLMQNKKTILIGAIAGLLIALVILFINAIVGKKEEPQE